MTVSSTAEVAVLVSLPSLLWRDFSSLTIPYVTLVRLLRKLFFVWTHGESRGRS